MHDPDFLLKLPRYQTARLKSCPDGQGYVRIKWVESSVNPENPVVCWMGLDREAKGQCGLSPASDLTDYVL